MYSYFTSSGQIVNCPREFSSMSPWLARSFVRRGSRSCTALQLRDEIVLNLDPLAANLASGVMLPTCLIWILSFLDAYGRSVIELWKRLGDLAPQSCRLTRPALARRVAPAGFP